MGNRINKLEKRLREAQQRRDYATVACLMQQLQQARQAAEAEPAYDLMMLPEKKEGWVNVFNHGNNDTYVGNIIFPTEELAKEAVSRMNGVKYIVTVKIEWEE